MNSQEIREKYIELFAQSPKIMVAAPGRINVIGEHTDYNLGFVLPAAVDKHIYFAIGNNPNSKSLHIFSTNFFQKIDLQNGRELPNDAPSWLKYIVTSLQILEAKTGKEIPGLNVCFGGDIPVGSGMSSSAALCCGFLMGIAKLSNITVDKSEIALMAQKTEHTIGINCGLMDQYACLFGKNEKVMLLDCQDLCYSHFPLSMEAHELLLINSMVQHELAAESGYNDRRKSCEDTVAFLVNKGEKVKSLRDVDLGMLKSHQKDLDPIAYQRCRYVIEENERVHQVVNLLKQEKVEAASKILFIAHEGMKNDYQITIPEIDFLVNQAKSLPGIVGARMMGGGFGGCTINIVRKNMLEQSKQEITKKYYDRYNIMPEVYVLKLSEGALIIH